MTTLKFKCTLLTDIILNMKSASEGNNRTLDFIPGNNFLGIAAGKLYGKVSPEGALDLFHNGTVRYGDAHLAVGLHRTLKIPAEMYYPKLEGTTGKIYIHSKYDPVKDAKKPLLKQCRDGFYSFADNGHAVKADVRMSYAQKSAYDRENLRSMDEKMFGYESLAAGLTFYFSVETDNDAYATMIEESLSGTRHLGRSRTAQYGLVEIEKFQSFLEVQSRPASSGDEIEVYADGRLIFLDENGVPTFQPTAEQLGVAGGKILWDKSQVRPFQYSPWNAKRWTYDADRCGIEKGSVFVVGGGSLPNPLPAAVGSYRHEGFGKVLYNPAFLDTIPGENGKSRYVLEEAEDSKAQPSENVRHPKSELIDFLCRKKQESIDSSKIYTEVNDFVRKHGCRFKGEEFASQWGEIRSIAMAHCTMDDIVQKIGDYLAHGVAAEKWKKNSRRDHLQEKLDAWRENLSDGAARQAVVNLASEMAKMCKNQGR